MSGRTACRSLGALVLILVSHPVSAQEAFEDFRFGTGDAVRIVVWEQPAMSGDFEIMVDRRIQHPLLQNVVVAGRTFPEVRDDVVNYLQQFQRTPLVVVTPLVRVSVGGAVNEPGIVSVDPRARLVELIGAAGGPTEDARLEYLEVVRNGERSRLQLWRDGAATESLEALDIGSGDLVVVPERRSVFREQVVPVAAFLGSLVGVANLVIQINNR